jgi:hypothetical protein
MTPLVKNALTGPDANHVRELFASVKGLIEKQDFAAAGKVLDELAPLLQRSAERPETPTDGKGGSFVNYAQARLRWDTAKKLLGADIKKLQDAIRADTQGSTEAPEAEKVVKNLEQFLHRFDDSLLDLLDEALNQSDAERRRAVNGRAVAVINEYLEAISSPRVEALDQNPYRPINVHARLSGFLKNLRKQLR